MVQHVRDECLQEAAKDLSLEEHIYNACDDWKCVWVMPIVKW